jgi:hypothetical protein
MKRNKDSSGRLLLLLLVFVRVFQASNSFVMILPSFSFQGSLSSRRRSVTCPVNIRLFRSNDESATIEKEIAALEKEVMESTRAKLDLQRVTRSLLDEDDSESDYASVPLEGWKVALAAASVVALGSFFIFHDALISAVVLTAIFLVANGDPLEEDTLAGALARLIGRYTIRSVQASQPKMRAIARAAVRGDEIALLRQQVKALQDENRELLLWKERRIAVDNALPNYSLEDLKQKARANGLKVGGTKTELLMRLVEAGVEEIL